LFRLAILKSMQHIEKITKRALLLFFLSASFYLYEFLLQVSPGVMSQTLMRDLHIDATVLGVMSGSFYYSYTFMQFPAGMLLDRFGSRIILTIVTSVCAIGALIFGFAPNVFVAGVARFIMGAASAFAFTGVLHLALRWFPIKRYAIFTGATEMMGSLGAIVGSVPLAIILSHYSWRTTMFTFGIIGICLALIIFLFVRDLPAFIKAKSRDIHLDEKHTILKRAKLVIRNPQNWWIGFYSFTVWAPVLGFSALWGVAFLSQNSGINTILAAKAVSFSWLGVALGSPLIGWFSELINRRCIVLAVPALIGAVSISTIIYVPNIPSAILDILMFCVGIASGGQTLAFAVVKDNNQRFICSTANGLNNMLIVSSGMLFQPLIGKLLDLNWHGLIASGVRVYDLHAYHTAFFLLPTCYLIACVVSLVFIKETKCRFVWEN
jgi:sugar phosphate permease